VTVWPLRVPRRRGLAARALRLALRLALWGGVLCVVWAAAYAVINPPITALMALEWTRTGSLERDWRPLSAISPHLARAAVAGEDARFCDHRGFDFEAIAAAQESNAGGGGLRGASTIPMQTAKNVFLWPDRSWLRKGLEAGFTVLIEAFWGKRRILEVYLNVAEFGEGVFGAEAAARHWFGKPAAALTLREASRLAAILPDPRDRNPARPSGFVQRRARAIAAGAETIRAEGRDRCFL
jgi:monofunctional biosynthetic peptidoglycan transglycosylase